MWTFEESFVVYEVSVDGLLKHPKDKYDQNVFNRYGYETKEEAMREIILADIPGNLVILPIVSRIYSR